MPDAMGAYAIKGGSEGRAVPTHRELDDGELVPFGSEQDTGDGPLWSVLPATGEVPDEYVRGDGTVAFPLDPDS